MKKKKIIGKIGEIGIEEEVESGRVDNNKGNYMDLEIIR